MTLKFLVDILDTRSKQRLGSSLNHDVILFLTIRPYGGVVEMREHVLLERDHGGLRLGRTQRLGQHQCKGIDHSHARLSGHKCGGL